MPYFLSSDNVKLFYEVSGKGKPLILVHGWSCNHQHFKKQIPELSKHYQVVVLDLRGHGVSEIPEEGLTIARMAQDVHDLIDHLNLTKPSIVGWSMGTSIIFEYVRNYGCDNLDKLCLIDMTPKIITDETWSLGLYGNFTYKDNVDILVALNSSWKEFAGGFVPAVFAESGCQDKELYQWAFEQAYKNSSHVVTRMWIDMAAKDYREDLSSIKVPTLITYGTESVLYSKETNEFMESEIPNSKLVPFEKCGHALQLEDSDKFNKELIDFIG